MPMQYVGETRNREVSFLLHPLNYTQLYHRLKTLLSQDEARIFGKPELLGDTTAWSAEGGPDGKLRETEQLSGEQKDELADRLETLKTSILAKVTVLPELAKKARELFVVPADTDLKAIVEHGQVHPLLVQWACTSNRVKSTIDPLSTFLARPRTNSANVSVSFAYNTGEPIAERMFFVEYGGKESREKTNGQGVYHRGRCKLGSSFTVYEKEGAEKTNLHPFTVEEGREYKVVFPYLTTAVLEVVDQKSRPLSEVWGSLHYDGKETPFRTDASGTYIFEKLEAGKEVEVRLRDHPQITARRLLNKENNELVLQVTLPQFSQVRIKVVDDHSNPQPHYPLQINCNGAEKDYLTDERGKIVFERSEVGTEIRVTDKNKADNTQAQTVSDGGNEITLVIQKVLPKFVKVRFLDRHNRPLVQIPVDFVYNGQTQKAVTNGDGVCTLPFEGFVDGKKVKTIVHLPKEEKTTKART